MPALDQQSDREPTAAPSDAAIMDRFAEHLARGAPGEGSSYDAMCDVVSHTGHVSKRCGACKGKGYRDVAGPVLEQWKAKIASETSPARRDSLRRDLSDLSTCHVCSGSGETHHEISRQRTLCDGCDGAGCKRCGHSGEVSLGPIDSTWTTTRCPKCRGGGEFLDEDAQDVCPLCRGKTYVIACTVREKGSSKKGRLPPGMLPADDVIPASAAGAIGPESPSEWTEEELAEFAAMARVRDRIRARSGEAADALETYFGAEGDRWGKHHWGRAFALWPHTDAGRALVADARRSSKLGSAYLLRPIDVLAAERIAEGEATVSNLRRRALIAAAKDQARAVLGYAEALLLAEASAG